MLEIRRATVDDAPACGEICYEAFSKINRDHGFPSDVPSKEFGIGLMTSILSHPGFYCVVAEADGKIVGSNCLDERSTVAGIGPITIDPNSQNRRVGRRLMDAVLDRTQERKFPGVRLVQAAFHNRSLSLYATLGFEIREPLSVMQGPAIKKRIEGCAVRRATESDLAACNDLCRRVHGHDRGGDVADAVRNGSAVVTERHGRITAYSSALAFFGHSVGETNIDIEALIGAADAFHGPGILVPSRNSELFRWCLAHGLRVVEPMTLMTIGLYNEPSGSYLCSIMY